jgi:hypothetical protein
MNGPDQFAKATLPLAKGQQYDGLGFELGEGEVEKITLYYWGLQGQDAGLYLVDGDGAEVCGASLGCKNTQISTQYPDFCTHLR